MPGSLSAYVLELEKSSKCKVLSFISCFTLQFQEIPLTVLITTRNADLIQKLLLTVCCYYFGIRGRDDLGGVYCL